MKIGFTVRATAVFLVANATASCGASIQAVYEGDVRFEHCMALDAQAEQRTAIRAACWKEWIAFYTYGQTRDRVLHAQARLAGLNAGDASLVAPAGPQTGSETSLEPDPTVTPPPSH